MFGVYAVEKFSCTEIDASLTEDTLIEKAVTDSEGKIQFASDLPLGKYYIQEIKAPKGYASNKEKVEIDASYNPTGEKVLKFESEFTDVPIKVQFSKTGITGENELEGAKLTIIDSDGKTIETWTSEKKPHMVEKIPVGKYTLREETSPYGYTIARDIEFEVKDTEEIQKCQMKDEYVFGKLLLKKRNSELNTMIEGVEFEIRDKDGKVIQTLVTGKDGCAESDLLPICTYDKNGSYDKDITYTVVETKAKEDYILDSTPHEVTFTYGREADCDGKTSDTIDKDCKAPEVVEYTLDLANTPTEPKLPQTGDNFNPWLCGLVGAMFIGFAIAYIYCSKHTDTFDESDDEQESENVE